MTLQLPTAISGVAAAAAKRLDALDGAVPPQPAPDLPFAEYVQQAREYAARDPLFRRQFEDALRQYDQIQAAQGGLP